MKKKIIFLAFCLILFLIFTASGYGLVFDPRFHGDPWEHMLSPKPDNDQKLNFVVLVINPHFYLIFKSQTKVENFNDLDKFPSQRSASSITQDSLNKNETRFQK